LPATLPPYPLDALVIDDAEVEYLLELEDQDDCRRRRRRRRSRRSRWSRRSRRSRAGWGSGG
jgi:hypothetical protein